MWVGLRPKNPALEDFEDGDPSWVHLPEDACDWVADVRLAKNLKSTIQTLERMLKNHEEYEAGEAVRIQILRLFSHRRASRYLLCTCTCLQPSMLVQLQKRSGQSRLRSGRRQSCCSTITAALVKIVDGLKAIYADLKQMAWDSFPKTSKSAEASQYEGGFMDMYQYRSSCLTYPGR